jgi:transposase
LDLESGEVLEESRVRTTPEDVRRRFAGQRCLRIALEVGKHSPWMCRLLVELGHQVIVANPRKVRLIWENRKKRDRIDARYLARLVRLDPELLHPVEHRSEQAQVDLAVLRSRAALVKVRTELINHVRGAVKSLGHRLPKCDAKQFGKRMGEALPESVRPALTGVVETIARLTLQITAYDRKLATLARSRYPETAQLTQVGGVGVLTGLAYRLVLDDPTRFARSRTVGAYLGLVPQANESGDAQPQLPINKEGDRLLRSLLVQLAHYILGPFGQDCDLRRHGLRIAARGGKAAKKRAVVAVARKLAVLLHARWCR